MRLFNKREAQKQEKTADAKIELIKVSNEEYSDETNMEQVFTCSNCKSEVPLSQVKHNLYVFPKCGKHAKMSARRRIECVADPDAVEFQPRADVKYQVWDACVEESPDAYPPVDIEQHKHDDAHQSGSEV